MTQQTITPREALEIHELLSAKNLCMTKAVNSISQVTDTELKQIIQDDITKTRTQITELKTLLCKADMSKMAMSGSTM
ncbi:hypothetical protein [Clostridium tyrobutyricum]|uniref:hypothetical protein n=1 Tax=Clostridium tyrobutyricum TaxID=1519 RepID=UPI00073D3133|nr:hypothetical protein [Clostridium tyrobutyricum]MBV4415791.1 hypothetical protein [Clostridium tyrobutyricum]